MVFSLEIKNRLLGELQKNFEADLELITHAAVTAREAATNTESKADNKYDTRGLEASYLAGAQAKRAAEIAELLKYYHFLERIDLSKRSTLGAPSLLTLECDGKKQNYFLIPRGSASSIKIEGLEYIVISMQSPLGRELLGRERGDSFELSVAGKKREYVLGDFI